MGPGIRHAAPVDSPPTLGPIPMIVRAGGAVVLDARSRPGSTSASPGCCLDPVPRWTAILSTRAQYARLKSAQYAGPTAPTCRPVAALAARVHQRLIAGPGTGVPAQAALPPAPATSSRTRVSERI